MASMPVEVAEIDSQSHMELVQALSIANSSQREFLFMPLAEPDNQSFKMLAYQEAHVKDLFDSMAEQRMKLRGYHPFVIAIVDTELRGENYGNLFGSHRAKAGLAVITTDSIQDVIIPKGKMAAYFLYYLARYTLSFIEPEYKNHEDSRGCVFDRKANKLDLLRSMRGQAVCDDCRRTLLSTSKNISPHQLNAVNIILELSGQILKGEENPITKIDNPYDKDLNTTNIDETEAITELSKIKTSLDQRAYLYAKIGLWTYFIILGIIWVILGILTYYFGWNTMEPWTYFLGGGVTLLSYAYFAITRREFSPQTIYNQIVEARKVKNYQTYSFDLEKFNRLSQAVSADTPRLHTDHAAG